MRGFIVLEGVPTGPRSPQSATWRWPTVALSFGGAFLQQLNLR